MYGTSVIVYLPNQRNHKNCLNMNDYNSTSDIYTSLLKIAVKVVFSLVVLINMLVK